MAADKLDAVDCEGIDGIPVLDRAWAEGGVVEADTIDEQQVLAAGEAANEWGAVAVAGFLDEHAGRELQDFGEGAAGVFENEIGIENGHGERGFGGLDADAIGADNEGVEKILSKGDGGGCEEKEGERDGFHDVNLCSAMRGIVGEWDSVMQCIIMDTHAPNTKSI